jgi:hypothetical protein
MESNPPPNDNDKNEKDDVADDVENAWIPLTVLEDDVTSSASLLAALDLAQAKTPLQRRGNYRPIGAFAVRPPGRGGGLASERSIDSQLTNDASTTTATATTRSLFRVPVADLVDGTVTSALALSPLRDIEIAEVYPGQPILGGADTTIATVDNNQTGTPQSKSFSVAAQSNQGVRRLQRCFPWCGRDSSNGGPYCSRLFYTLLCLLLVVLLIVAIVLAVKFIQDKQTEDPTTKKKLLVPRLNKNTTVPEILDNGTN